MSITTFFNTSYYLTQYTDVADNWVGNVVDHYARYGYAEGRAPASWFNASYYRSTYTDLSTLNALQLWEHYSNYGYQEGRATSSTYASFDAANYLATYADLGTAGITATKALNHYMVFGQTEGRTARNTDGSTIASQTGSTYNLTISANSFTGTSGNDTFDGSFSSTGAQTWGSSDALNGGAGTDSIIAQLSSSLTPTSLTSIENVTVTTSAALTLDLTNGTSVTSFTSSGATGGALTVQGISKAASVTVQDTAQNHTITYNDVTGSADSATITVNNVTGGVLTVAGVETLTLASGGSSNTITTLTTAAATKLNVTGSKALTITDNLGGTVATVDASAATGAVDVDLAAGAATVTGGTGNDVLQFEGAGAVSVSGGAGNDSFNFAIAADAFAATFGSTDTVAGGDGTDTLTVDIDQVDTAAITTALTTITGIETLNITGTQGGTDTVTVANLSSAINRVNLSSVTSGNSAINFNAGTNTLGLNIAAAITAGTTLTLDAAGTGSADALTITNMLSTGESGSATSAVTITDFETVTIATGSYTTAAAQNLGAVNAGTTAAVSVTGGNGLTIAAGLVASSIDASGLTGTGALTMSGAATTITTITGSANADTLVGDTSSSIVGGAGNDTITGGAGNDTISGGDGVDQITTNGGAGDSVDGGAGNDTIIATLTSGNTITGGEGTDILSLGVAATAATAAGVSGFETLTDTAGIAQSMALFGDNTTFTKINCATGTASYSNVGSSTNTLGLTGNTTSVTFARLLDTTSNELTISATGGTTATAIVANDEETVNISSTNSTAVIVTDFTSSDLKTLNISGSSDVTFTNALTGTTVLQTVSAANATGAVTVIGSASIVAITATGGSGVFTFTGGSAGDAITGGANADVLSGGGGNDTINGGDGADTLIGGAGVDSLTGGAGADQYRFIDSIASGTPSATAADRVIGWTDGTDFIGISAGNTFGSAGGTGLAAGAGAGGSSVAIAAGATVVQSVAQSAGAAAVTAAADLIKLTTAVATGLTDQATFNTAIGTSTVTGMTASTLHLVSLYDQTLGQMVLMEADLSSTTNTVLETGDTIRVIGRVDMSSTDYSNFTTADILFY